MDNNKTSDHSDNEQPAVGADENMIEAQEVTDGSTEAQPSDNPAAVVVKKSGGWLGLP